MDRIEGEAIRQITPKPEDLYQLASSIAVIKYGEPKPLDLNAPLVKQLAEDKQALISRSSGSIMIRLERGYAFLRHGDVSVLHKDIKLVVEATSSDEVSDSIDRIVRAYNATCPLDAPEDVRKKQILTDLFRELLIKEIISGNNRNYNYNVTKNNVESKQARQVWKVYLQAQLFVKVDYMARCGYAIIEFVEKELLRGNE